MAWTFTGSVGEYLAQAGDFLRARPAEHTIELAAAENLLAVGPHAYGGGPPLFGWWRPAGGPVLAGVLHTPPFPLLVAGPVRADETGAAIIETATTALAGELASRARVLAGVNGPDAVSAAFAAAWQQRTGATATPGRKSRLYVLGELTELAQPPGTARVAGPADAGLLRRWLDEFAAETAGGPAGSGALLADRLSYGGLTVWEDDATPVALAGRNRAAAGVIRIGPVYTPPGLRRRGYAAAVTAAVSRAARAAGATVVLFTDLASPASNALYPRLGYRRVSDRQLLALTPPRGRPRTAVRVADRDRAATNP